MGHRFQFGSFELDTERRLLARDSAPIPLGSRAFSVLRALLEARGRVVSKEDLIAAGWPGLVVEEGNLSVQVAALRKILSPAAQAKDWIVTVPRIGYRFAGPMHVLDGEYAPDSEHLADKPYIVVLPFVNLSGEPEQEYFVDAVSEDLIAALSRFRWFYVIARNSSFALKGRSLGAKQVAEELGVRYVLEGSVRKSGSRVRVLAALNEAPCAKQIWSDRYDFELTDIFAVQDEIVEHVVGAIEPELLKNEAKRPPATKRTSDLTAWELVRQGMHCFHKITRETHWRARQLFREAASRDAESPDPYIWIARVSAGMAAYGWSADAEADLREGVAAAFEAIRRDERSPYSCYALAITSAYAGAPGQAIRAAERALELNPGFALGYLVLGMARLFAGQAAAAVTPLERGLRLNPHDPQNFAWYNLLAFARYLAGQPNEALRAAETAREIRPDWRRTLEVMACCHLALGQTASAAHCIEQMKGVPRTTDKLLEPLVRQTDIWQQAVELPLRAGGWRDS